MGFEHSSDLGHGGDGQEQCFRSAVDEDGLSLNKLIGKNMESGVLLLEARVREGGRSQIDRQHEHIGVKIALFLAECQILT